MVHEIVLAFKLIQTMRYGNGVKNFCKCLASKLMMFCYLKQKKIQCNQSSASLPWVLMNYNEAKYKTMTLNMKQNT